MSFIKDDGCVDVDSMLQSMSGGDAARRGLQLRLNQVAVIAQ